MEENKKDSENFELQDNEVVENEGIKNKHAGKTRLLYFVPEFPVISQTFIEREISKLIQLPDFDVTVFSLKKANGSTSDEVLQRVTFKKLSIFNFFGVVVFVFKNFNAVKNAFEVVKGKDRISFVKRLWHYVKGVGYAYLFSEKDPDHIHVNFLSDISNIIMVAAQILDVPYSISAHAKDIFIEHSLTNSKARTAKFITVCNKKAYGHVYEMVEEEFRYKILLNYHGFDYVNALSVPVTKEKGSKPSIFLGGTRLVEKKGIQFMISASKILKDRGVSHRIDLVGPGDLYVELSNQIKELGLEENITIHGEGEGTPFEEVLQFYKTADIFVYPALDTADGDSDGVPTVVIEASMFKLPIITTNAGSISDLITRENGIIVPQRDAYAIANAVEKLIYHPDQRQELGQKAHQKAINMFDINRNIGTLREFILT